MRSVQPSCHLPSRVATTTCAFLAALCFSLTSTSAQTNTNWKGGPGNWSVKWTNGAPNGSFKVFIDRGGRLNSTVKTRGVQCPVNA
jgi:hypothetical protein